MADFISLNCYHIMQITLTTETFKTGMLLGSDELNSDNVHGMTILTKLKYRFFRAYNQYIYIYITLVKTQTTETHTCTAIYQTMIHPMILGFVVCIKRINVYTKLQITKGKLKVTPDCYYTSVPHVGKRKR